MRGGTLLSPRNSVGGNIVMRPFVGAWMSESVPPSVCLSCFTCGQDSDYSFAKSLSNFTCKLWMMRVGTLLIWGHRVKGQGQLWHSVYKTLWTRYRLQFLPNHFQTSHVSCGWWEEKPYWLWVSASKVKVIFGTLFKSLVGRIQITVYVQSLSKFSCRLWMMREGTPLIFCHGGQRSRSTLALCV